MKKNLKHLIVAALVAVIYLLPSAAKAQARCPYTIINNKACTVCINWEVRVPPASPPVCGTICNGQVCIPPGGSFNIPGTCCPANVVDVVTTVLSVNGIATIAPTPCRCCCGAGLPNVMGTYPGTCNGMGGYTVTWGSSQTVIN